MIRHAALRLRSPGVCRPGPGSCQGVQSSLEGNRRLPWFGLGPPTLPTPTRAVDPRRWQCFLRKAAPQALPQISLCDVGWGGPALASGGVPSLGLGQSSLPLPQIDQTGCSPARPLPPPQPRGSLLGSGAPPTASASQCPPRTLLAHLGTDRGWRSGSSPTPDVGTEPLPRHTALLSTPTGSGRAPLPHALLVPALARGAGGRRLTPPGPCAALSQRVVCLAAALGARQGREQCRRDGPSPSHGLTLSGGRPQSPLCQAGRAWGGHSGTCRCGQRPQVSFRLA